MGIDLSKAGFWGYQRENGRSGVRNHVHQGPGRSWTKWSAPEVHTDNKIGTPDDPVIQPGEGNSPLVIGGWARLSVLLAERGVQAEQDAGENLKAAYKRFMDEQEPARKNEAGKNLVRAIFGNGAIAEDTIR